MARKGFEQKNIKSAKNFNFLDLLEFIGSPFFKILSFVVISFLFVSKVLGTTIIKVSKFIKPISKSPKKKKVSSPKKELSILNAIKIFLLKTRLLLVRVFAPRRIKIGKKVIFFSLVLSSLIFIIWFFIFKGLPSPTELTTRQQDISTKIYSEDGVLLYQIYKDENRTLVSLKDVPENLKLATLAAEDAEFYSHPGFSIRGIIRAIFENATENKQSGGSTITQQLVKNALLTPEKTLSRKIKELVLSIRVEMTYSKDEILEMYLNEVSYGVHIFFFSYISIYLHKPKNIFLSCNTKLWR